MAHVFDKTGIFCDGNKDKLKGLVSVASNGMNYRLTPELLMKAIEGEQNAIAGYEHMKQMTPDRKNLETLEHIIGDGQKHLDVFTEMYKRRFGELSGLPGPAGPAACNFTDCVARAADKELETYELYRNIYMNNGGEQIRMPFFEAMTDKSGHAVRLNMMFARELERRLV
ncbi:MAG: ferritin-like domain-containing protein [Oscillospiraceae bacterium]|nr:ferritin-like domain-containing protein [Oscillospiraceae bacterium]